MDGIKAKRAAALEEKRRRLDELKARRNQRSAGSNTSSAVSASKTGNLDEYIDGLLNSAAPVVPIAPVAAAAPSTPARGPEKKLSKIDQLNQKTAEALSSPTPSAVDVPLSPMKKVETFTMSTQTDEDDFPMPLLLETTSDDEGDASEKSINMQASAEDQGAKKEDDNKEERYRKEPSPLTEDEVNHTISSAPFSSFFNSASKKVERLLGAPLLSDLLVDDTLYYADKESKRDAATSTRDKEHSMISAHVAFSCPKWTANRDVTSLDWSPHHRGELMLATYHMPSSSKSTIGSSAISAVAPNSTNSSSLFPRSRTEMTGADGLTVLWSLAMPSRPEHIFTCGSPVLNAKFHPTEGALVVGACYSGQVVVWDVRTGGRLPVQKSSLNLLGGSGGHVHPVVGLETLDVSIERDCENTYL